MGKSKGGAARNGGRGSNGHANANGGGDGGGEVHRRRSSSSAKPAPPTTTTPPASDFSIDLSGLFILLSFGISAAVAFSVGFAARVVLLSHLGISVVHAPTGSNADLADDPLGLAVLPASSSGGMSKKIVGGAADAMLAVYQSSGKKPGGPSGPQQLPSPKILAGKEVPLTTYASKSFPASGAATSHTLHIDRTSAFVMSRSKKEFDGGPDFQGGDRKSVV